MAGTIGIMYEDRDETRNPSQEREPEPAINQDYQAENKARKTRIGCLSLLIALPAAALYYFTNTGDRRGER